MKKIWELLNGKKTNIGATLLVLALAMTNLGDIWSVEAEWWPNLIDTFEWLGGFLGGGGLAHKVTKLKK